jgi:hypothetical protein
MSFNWLSLIPLGVILLPISWLWVRQNMIVKSLENIYSKDETKEMIDLKQQPMKDALDRNNEVCTELTRAIIELRLELEKLRKES